MPRLRRILLAFDGSKGATQALVDLKRNRAGLAGDVEMIVLCVADMLTAERFGAFGIADSDAVPVTEAQLRGIQEAERTALRRARQVALKASEELRAEHPGWEVRAESCADAPAWGIIKRAEEWKADLIVLGSHGRSAFGRVILGSVSHAVVREAPCSVRIVRGHIGARYAPVRLAIGFDASADAEAAVQAVAERAWPAGSLARLVTAIDGRLSAAVPLVRRAAKQQTWMHRMIEDPVERLRAAGLTVSTVVKLGDPRNVLLAEARRWEADTVFVGARGVRGIRRFLLGSVSTAVAMQGPCPVEVVRSALSRPAGGEPVRREAGLHEAAMPGAV
jgi:nucleotide-binding universal stress UspA family protein